LSLRDVHKFIVLLSGECVKTDVDSSSKRPKTSVAEPPEWSIFAMICLTAYRFYTGFLSATWLPYLLAMEGQDLWDSKQSLFMGLAKLIYGVTILLNPVFGLIGDQAVSVSHGVGRRLFVRIGGSIAAIGIYICILSAKQHAFLSFLAGIFIWRLGEALNDVTTEAIVPEMIPQKQYGIASSIKASSFLLGGLLGYSLLIIFAKVHYGWLYYAYLFGMFTCAIPSLMMLDNDVPLDNPSRRLNQESFSHSLARAYIAPSQYKGGFPRACLAVFVFSLGTSPMFFLLLIIRDVVGVTEPVELQRVFSVVSLVFFLSAALFSVLSGIAPKRIAQLCSSTGDEPSELESRLSRGKTLAGAMLILAVVLIFIPCLAFFELRKSRIIGFYALAAVFGAAFGAAFSTFQDLTWQLLPPNANFANAMGFNIMCRLFGLGLGNFVAGIILDISYAQMGAPDDPLMVYKPGGYAVMCGCCFVATITSCGLAYSGIVSNYNELEGLVADKLEAAPAA